MASLGVDYSVASSVHGVDETVVEDHRNLGPYPVIRPTSVVIAAAAPAPRRLVPAFHDKPVSCTCPNCQSEIVSQMTFEIGTYTVVLCLILIVLGLWLGCCVIPFFLDGCKDVVHHCPHCRSHLGTYRKM